MTKRTFFFAVIVAAVVLTVGASPGIAGSLMGGGFVELPDGTRLPSFPVYIYDSRGSRWSYHATVYTDHTGKWTYSTSSCWDYFIACIIHGPYNEDGVCVWTDLECDEFRWFPDLVFPCGPGTKKPCPHPGGSDPYPPVVD